MSNVPAYPIPDFAPLPSPDAVVKSGGLRVTVLTPRLLRIEYSPVDRFEDRPSQPFWYRSQKVPAFSFSGSDPDAPELVVETGHLVLRFVKGQTPSAVTLSVELKDLRTTWHYGDVDQGNLMGTYRTLDTVDGSVTLETGLISRDGWVVVDDSGSLVFTEDGWLAPRETPDGQLDLYFFGYGRDYKSALRDFRKIAGPVPMLPRWALGNWWSRYWKYSDAELRQLVLDFEANEIPLSVCIIDMDWHVTDTGNQSSGWTGYTWNREYFPEPGQTIEFLHEHGLKTALNLHPAEGVHPHEAAYEAFARRMGMDPASQEPIPFELADRTFAQAYFELLHHPEEDRGVDFWWIDWQQGTLSSLPGLDPLWWLNHLHFYDLARPQAGDRPVKRPFIFSRWGGLGNHRYPIGFSGDTVITWHSLAFQPVFTSTAANVGYGWWSHDIGGHYGGIKDAELYTRWVQYGVLSPILRLHSTANAQLERRPFGWDAETLRLTRKAMQFRHRLIPYLYTMSWRDHTRAESPIRPMYHDHPDEESAYCCPDQYTFGSELFAAPYVQPRGATTGLSRQVVWLPHEAWHFFTGSYFSPGWHALYGDLDDIPLFAKPGAIVPLCEPDDWEQPDALEIHVFPGASNTFDLYEDGGQPDAVKEASFHLTRFSLDWNPEKMVFRIHPEEGSRTYTLKFRGILEPENAAGEINGEDCPLAIDYDEHTRTLTVSPPDIDAGDGFTLVLGGSGRALPGVEDEVRRLQHIVQSFKLGNTAKQVLFESVSEIVSETSKLAAFRVVLDEDQMRALAEVLYGAGVHLVEHTNEPVLVLWNRDGRKDVRYELSTEHYRRWLSKERFRLEKDRVPPFKGYLVSEDLKETFWLLTLRYADLLEVRLPRSRTGPFAPPQ